MNKDFLDSNKFLLARVNTNREIYPAEGVLLEFQKIAKTIDPIRHFTIYGCQECIQSLVKFVYENSNDTSNDAVAKLPKKG